MKKNILYLLDILLLSFNAPAQRQEPKVIFNTPVTKSIETVDFFNDGSKTFLVSAGEDFIGYNSPSLKELYRAKHPNFVFQTALPLRNNMVAYDDGDEHIYVQDAHSGIMLFHYKYENLTKASLAYDNYRDLLIIALRENRNTVLYGVNLKSFKSTPLKITLKDISINAITCVSKSGILLLEYEKDNQNYLSVTDPNGRSLQTLPLASGEKTYHCKSGQTFFCYGDSGLLKEYHITVVNADSALIQKTPDKVLPFCISKIYDDNLNQTLLLFDIKTKGDSIFGNKITGREIQLSNGSKQLIPANKWWDNFTYVFNLPALQLQDSVRKSGAIMFIADSSQLVIIDQRKLGVLAEDTLSIRLYDFNTKKEWQVNTASLNLSRITAASHYAPGNLLAFLTADAQLKVINTAHSKNLVRNESKNILFTSSYPQKLIFTRNGKFLVVVARDAFFVYMPASLNSYYSYYAPKPEKIKRVITGKTDKDLILETTGGVYSFDLERITRTPLLTTTDGLNEFASNNTNSYFLNDTLLFVSGPMNYGFKIFNIRTKKQFYQYIPSNKIHWVSIDTVSKIFSIHIRSNTLTFNYSNLSHISFTNKELVTDYGPDVLFPFQTITHSEKYRAELETNYAQYNIYRKNGDQRQNIILSIPSVFSDEDHYEVINPDISILDLGNDLLGAFTTDGIFEVYDMLSRRKTLSLVFFKNYGWLAYSPAGYFDIHHSIVPNLSWYDFSTNNYFSFDYLYNDFFEPRLFDLTLSRKLKKPVFDISSYLKIPSLQFSKIDYRLINKQHYAFFPNIDGVGMLGLKKYLDAEGLVLETTTDKNYPARVKLPANIEINEGAEKLREPASNLDSTDSKAKRKGNLYIASIGVGKYPEETGLPELNATRPSIDFFQNMFIKYNVPIKNLYDSILFFTPLVDSNATRNKILDFFVEVINKLKNEDVLALYLCGHGVIPVQSELFCFLPYDAALGSRESILASCINSATLVDVVRYIQSGKIIIVLDACQAGGSLESLDKIGQAKSQHMVSAGYEKASVNVFASSTAYDPTFQSKDSVSHILNMLDRNIESLLKAKNIVSLRDIQSAMDRSKEAGSLAADKLKIMNNNPPATFNLFSRRAKQ